MHTDNSLSSVDVSTTSSANFRLAPSSQRPQTIHITLSCVRAL